ncbi:hypothetical protein ACJ41O_012401 [Fusarium nematophilum]
METSMVKEQSSVRLRAIVNAVAPFAVGCGSGMIATMCVQPIDTVKVRMQLMDRTVAKVSPWSIARDMLAKGGLVNLYQGLSAALLKQLIYGTTRLGLFYTFEKHLDRRAREQGGTLGFGGRALAGIGAGSIAALVGNPTEVALVRMQADGMRPLELQKNYRSAFEALRRICVEEGVLVWWKGAAPNMVRAMSTNFGQLAFFSESKHQIGKHTDLSVGKRTVLAAAVAGLAGTVVSLPFDFVKTRLQNQSMAATTPGSIPMYSGTVDCLVKTVQREGPLRFYRDFWPYLIRVAPHS